MGVTSHEPSPAQGVCPICWDSHGCDCLERILCANVGELGHWSCGVCPTHEKPRFQCGCLRKQVVA